MPRRAVPSNIRWKSSDVRNIAVRNFVQEDTNTKDADYNSRFNPVVDRSKHLTTENQASRYSTKSVDHVRDYIEKKKLKEELFSHLTGKSNIIEFEKFIKSKNPDLNWRNDEWKTPLHVATEINMSTAWISILIRYGADLNRLSPDNKTALHYAWINNNESVVALLLKWKANTGNVDKDGNSPINIAMKNENKEIVTLLLSKSKDLNLKFKHLKSQKSYEALKQRHSNSKKRLKNTLDNEAKIGNYTANTDNINNLMDKEDQSPINSQTQNLLTKYKNSSSLRSMFSNLYKSKRAGKTSLSKGKYQNHNMFDSVSSGMNKSKKDGLFEKSSQDEEESKYTNTLNRYKDNQISSSTSK